MTGSIATPIHCRTVARELENQAAAVHYPEGTVPLTQGEVGEPVELVQLKLFSASDAAGHITGTEIWTMAVSRF